MESVGKKDVGHCGARLIDHLTEGQRYQFQVRSEACQYLWGERIEDMVLPRQGRYGHSPAFQGFWARTAGRTAYILHTRSHRDCAVADIVEAASRWKRSKGLPEKTRGMNPRIALRYAALC
jgi:hypothetical protein